MAQVVTPSTIDPLTVITAAEVDEWSNDLRGADDMRIPTILGAAIEHVEAMLNRAVLQQTRRTVTRCYPLGTLHVEPFDSISITRVDEDGSSETLDADQFVIDAGSGTIDPRTNALYYGESYAGWSGPYFPWRDATWFSAQRRYRFDYVCGWTAASMPAEIKVAILGICAHIARFKGALTSAAADAKMLPKLPDSYSLPVVHSPAWVIA